jgi:solute carrier family 25, member 34/35
MNGTRLGLYHYIEDRGWLRDPNGSSSALRSITGGATAGACGAFVASPFYMVKFTLRINYT